MTSETMNGESNSNEASASKSQEEVGKDSSMSGNEHDSEKGKQTEKTESVPFYKLFTFADSADIALMIIGSIGAIGNGLCLPLMTLLFGDLINTFGDNQNNSETVDKVSKVIPYCFELNILG